VQTPYVSFGLWSRRMPASEMAERLGLEPDEIAVRGANLVDPPVPVSHEWMITCRDPHKSVDEQVEQLLERLRPFAEHIGLLAADLRHEECGGARLRVVRQHPEHELGWRLDRTVLQFLEQTSADVEVAVA
jgi:hypothetical protein